MKKFLKNFVVAILLLCSFSLFGCDYGGSSGKSAYDLAVENGYTGTVSEWLESLKGEKGDNGLNGADGSLTAKSMFEAAIENGLYVIDSSDPDSYKKNYQQFLRDYFVQYSETTLEKVSAECLNQVVSVCCPISRNYYSVGSGVFYRIEENYAYIITNYHVIALQDYSVEGYSPSDTIYCYLYNMNTLTVKDNKFDKGEKGIEATYIGGSAEYDLAVLMVTKEDSMNIIKNSSARTISFGDSDKIKEGQRVIAVGNPEGGGLSVTSGFVSQTSEDINVTIAGAVRSLRCIRTDTAVNPGNSGGGLFNLEGELLGIVNAKITDEEIEGMANAICSNNVKNVIENIVYNFESQASETRTTVGVKKVYLGLTYTVCDQNNVFDEETSVNTTTNALLVGEVIKDSVADRMGLKSGDKVYGITVNGGATIYFDRVVDQIKDFILTLRVDDKVSLAIKTKDDSGNYGESCTASTTVTLLESDFKVSKDNARTKSSSSSATNTVDEVA